MMAIRVLCVGALGEGYLKEGCREYLKRLTRYAKVDLIEVKDEADTSGALKREGERLLKHIDPLDHVITLEIEGQAHSSEGLAGRLKGLEGAGQRVTFIIGGSGGLDEAVRKRANEALSFSKMTFPHQLMRLILLEQVYRAFRINAGHPYHK